MKNKKGSVMPRYSISLTPKNIEQIEALQAELGYASMNEAIRNCISLAYTKTFPSYARTVNQSTANAMREPVLTPAQKEKAKLEARAEVDKQRKATEVATCVNICENELDGIVGEDEHGNPQTCAYFQYEGRRRYEQEIDILSVSSELVANQYLPSKDRVLLLQQDGNVDYDPSEHIAEVKGAEPEN